MSALALVFGSGIYALAALGATVIFVPGVMTIANYAAWPRFLRFVVCLAYVALAEVTYLSMFVALSAIAKVVATV